MNYSGESKQASNYGLSEALKKTQPYLITVGIFILLTGIWLWQVLGQVGSAVIGRDASFIVWAFWWLGRALHLNLDVMITDYPVYPFQQNLLLALSPLASLLFSALRRLSITPALSFNLLYLVSTVFTGCSMLAYLRYLKVSRPIALFVAVLFTFSPVLYYQLLMGRPDLMAIGWIPLGCLVLDKMRVEKKYGFWFSVILIGTVLTSFQVTLWAIAIWLPYSLITVRKTAAAERRTLINQLLLQGLVVAAVYLIYPLPGLLKTLGGLAPPVQALSLRPGDQQTSICTFLFGLLVIGLLARSLTTKNLGWMQKQWLAIALFCLMLSGAIALAKTTRIPHLILTGGWIVPIWFAVCLLIALSLDTRWQAQTVSPSSRWWQGSALVALLLGLSLVLHPTPQTTAWNQTQAYHLIGRQTGDYAILEVPFGVASLETGQHFGDGAHFQQYAVIHRKRTLNGSIFGVGTEPLNAYPQSPLFRYLAGEIVQPDAAMAQELQTVIQRERIGYLIVEPSSWPLEMQKSMLNFFSNQKSSLCKVFTDATATVVYRTLWHPSGCSKALGE